MKSRISKITVGRLYNLGDYEHIRYDLTVDIPEGESAAQAISAVERIMAGLKPLRRQCLSSETDLAHAAGEIQRMKEASDEIWQRNWGHCTGTRPEVIARYEEQHAENTAKRHQAIATAAKARALFDDLAGAEHFKDAKLDWQDDD